MTNADKERLFLSGVLTIVFYAAIFLVTGWLNILEPEEPPYYAGAMYVQLSLEPSFDPNPVEQDESVDDANAIAAETTTTETVIEQTEPVPQPTPELTTNPEPVPVQPEPIEPVVAAPVREVVSSPAAGTNANTRTQTPSPTTQPSPSVSAPVTETVAASQPASVTPAPVSNPVSTSVETPVDAAASDLPETAAVALSSAAALVAAPVAEPVSETRPQAANGRETPASTESASTYRSDTATVEEQSPDATSEFFEDLPGESSIGTQTGRTVTESLLGEGEAVAQSSFSSNTMATGVADAVREADSPAAATGIEYGDDTGETTATQTSGTTQVTAASGGTTGTSTGTVDLDQLDNRLANVAAASTGQNAQNQNGDGNLNTDASGTTPGNQQIVASNLQELTNQRQLLRRVDPDFSDLLRANPNLFEGKRLINVRMSFDITPQGFVTNDSFVQSSGNTAVDAKISEALKQWRFVRLNQNQVQTNQTAVLSWEIQATTE